jgi:hypothetical protein
MILPKFTFLMVLPLYNLWPSFSIPADRTYMLHNKKLLYICVYIYIHISVHYSHWATSSTITSVVCLIHRGSFSIQN